MTHLIRRSGARNFLKVRLSASPIWVLKNFNRPAECASISIARNLPRNRRASTLTCTRKFDRDEIHLLPSAEMPPPGTIMCRSPGMQHRGDADAGAKVLGIGRD